MAMFPILYVLSLPIREDAIRSFVIEIVVLLSILFVSFFCTLYCIAFNSIAFNSNRLDWIQTLRHGCMTSVGIPSKLAQISSSSSIGRNML